MIDEMAGDHLTDGGMTEGGGHWIEKEKSDGGPPLRIGANRETAGRLISTHSVRISIFCRNEISIHIKNLFIPSLAVCFVKYNLATIVLDDKGINENNEIENMLSNSECKQCKLLNSS